MAESIAPSPAATSGRLFWMSRRRVLMGAGSMAAGVGLGSLSGVWRPAEAHAAGNDGDNAAILQFHTMAPVTGMFVGAPTNKDGGVAIRGIHGGGFPWALAAADGELSTDGRLRVRVRGLVLAGGPASVVGTNPIPTFRAIVSFASEAPIFTDRVPASTAGDAEIDTHVELPRPGFAPIIFVAHGTVEAWFAVTGVM